MQRSRITLGIILILLPVGLLPAQTAAPGLEPRLNFEPGVRMWGGGYEGMSYFRNPDGSLFTGTEPGSDSDIAPYYNDTNFEWSLGVTQGILRLADANAMEVFLFLRGRYDDNHLSALACRSSELRRRPAVDGPGGVRGSESGNYDAPFKAVNCLDIRLNLPALFGLDITPTLLVFFDAGYYRSTGDGGDGFLFSTGGGLYVDVLNLATLGVSTRLLLNRSRVGQPNGWEAISLELGTHF